MERKEVLNRGHALHGPEQLDDWTRESEREPLNKEKEVVSRK